MARVPRGPVAAVMLRIKIFLGAFFVLILCGSAVYITHQLSTKSTVRTYGTAAVLKEVQGLNELVTVKFIIEKVIGMSDVNMFGEDRVLLIAHGVVKAGVRLDELKAEDIFPGENGGITIRLPKAKILDVYLDEKRTQVYERKTGLLRRFNKDLEKHARDNAIDSVRAAAEDMEILTEAQQRAEQNVSSLLTALGFKTVRFLPN